ncbi:glycoside hydrolase family 3 protein [Coniophora puteana RWD-64-598 SS2]|uniref:beta-glucosidase n=1 Tax=Coniophora puteana (strain RWD-64-598) TaxID=741705 RepID=A0A5M3MSX3_CONPW|nr:glycoside hydrolase family 3 protein [Coniophora puteana RWD-64-598 SS2]EIW82269.1 glycoside hydrolase family 3 protein [Coniophora puteana RWD-64-598 SS2]
MAPVLNIKAALLRMTLNSKIKMLAGCHILLAPTVNTQCSPTGGHSSESFTKDPVLNGNIAAAYINGFQSKGVSATIKHYVANTQEFQSSKVSERALQEIYLKPFQIAIHDSNPWALMIAYNRVNGEHVSDSKKFVNDILREEWGFKGMVMSDWIDVYTTSERPTVMRGKAVERALAGEQVFVSDIDDRVRKRAQASGIPFNGPEEGRDTPEVCQLMRRASADTVVLLRNDKKILLITGQSAIKKIAVIGPNAKNMFFSGGGSACLKPTYVVTPLEGIKEAMRESAFGCSSHRYLPPASPYLRAPGGQKGPGAFLEFWNELPSTSFIEISPNFSEQVAPCAWATPTADTKFFMADGVDSSKVNEICWIRYSTTFVPDKDGDWELGLNVTGQANLFLDGKLVIDLSTNPERGENFMNVGTVDVIRSVKGLKAGQEYHLKIRLCNEEYVKHGPLVPGHGGLRLGAFCTIDPEDAIKKAVQNLKDADLAVIVAGINHEWESKGFDHPDLELPGLINRLIPDIIAANPNTVIVNQSGSPVHMPWADQAHTLLQTFYGGNKGGHGIADILFGKGVFVGYRNYEKRGIAPRFPFGFGLSYTTFEFSNASVTPISEDSRFSVSFTIKNTGKDSGREVGQVYIADPDSSLPCPGKELKGFTKVNLKPGEEKKATVELTRDAISFYDERQKAWVVEAGTFEVYVSASSADIKLSTTTELKQGFTWIGL